MIHRCCRVHASSATLPWRRLRKRRHRVQDGPRLWEIDEFLDRELVLAEVELPAEDVNVELPKWLKAVLIREVTNEPGFSGKDLAL